MCAYGTLVCIESPTYRCMRMCGMQVAGALAEPLSKKKKKNMIQKMYSIRAAQLVLPMGKGFPCRVPPGEAREREIEQFPHAFFLAPWPRHQKNETPPRTTIPSPDSQGSDLRTACVRAWPLQATTGRICPAQNHRRRYPARRSGCLSVRKDRRVSLRRKGW